MQKRTILNLACAVLGVLAITAACSAAGDGGSSALVAPVALSAAILKSPEIDAKVAALLKQMTLAEKLGQLSQFSNGDATGPDNIKIDQGQLAAQGGIGSILNLSAADACNELQRQAVEKSRLKIPILFGLDVIHGHRTVYPIPLGLSAAWDADLAQRCARMAAVEATADGIRWNFSPMVDIARDARWGRIAEGSGEDPYLGSIMAAAWVRGYQGTDLSAVTAMLACPSTMSPMARPKGDGSTTRPTSRSGPSATSIFRPSRRRLTRRRPIISCLQYPARRAVHRESPHPDRHSQDRMGLPGTCRQRLRLHQRTDRARRGDRWPHGGLESHHRRRGHGYAELSVCRTFRIGAKRPPQDRSHRSRGSPRVAGLNLRWDCSSTPIPMQSCVPQ